MRPLRSLAASLLSLALCAAQEMPGMHDHMHMPGMARMSPAEDLLMSQASGTSMNPRSWRMPMIVKPARGWNLMFMGQLFLVDTQQSGPRGRDKLYSANWFMFSAERRAGKGAFMLQLMPSLEPLTITNRRYPELFQTGETAYGKPLADAQHPHDLFMAMALNYAYPLGENTILQLYAAPVGDPALGPVAFPHRASAAELPEASLGHHWQDSTHIADDVLTLGLTHRFLRLEASGFHGAEPGENRWNIDYGPIDSWSARLSLLPSPNWIAQVSLGRLSRPERQQPGDVVRSTASLHYTRPVGARDWSSSFIWGRNHETLARSNTNSYLLESVFPLRRRNFLTGRIELVDKNELFADTPELEDQLALAAGSTFRIGAFTIGYTRDVDLFPYIETGIGANFSAYTLPPAIKPYYGAHPLGVNVYLRARLRARSAH